MTNPPDDVKPGETVPVPITTPPTAAELARARGVGAALRALYGRTADEPVPQEIAALLNKLG